jgi:hypothetical protein
MIYAQNVIKKEQIWRIMTKKIENLVDSEKLDLLEYSAFKISQIKAIMAKATTDYDKKTLNGYIKHLKSIILKIKETL